MPKTCFKIGEPIFKNNIEVNENRYTRKNVENSVLYNDDLNSFLKNEILIDKTNASPPLAAAVLGINNTAAPLPENKEYYHCWTEIDAQEVYINSKPTCYLILSKPGSDAYYLGESLSKKINCVHLSPRNILIDEIEQQSSTGKCLVFNMKHNKVIKYDTILKILRQKLQSPTVIHRGYIMSGFPLVPSQCTLHYFIDDLYKEESINIVEYLIFDIICNLKKTKTKKSVTSSSVSSGLEVEAENAVEEEQEVNLYEEVPEATIVELPKFLLTTCHDILVPKKSFIETSKSVLLKQLDKLHFLIEPNIIIYITGPDEDMIIKQTHKYTNYISNNIVCKPFITKVNSEFRWPWFYKTNEYTPPFIDNIFNPKYNCRQPHNFGKKANEKLCNYNEHAFPYIDKKLKDFDPKNIIKVDGRNTVHQIIHNVTENLTLLPIKPVLLPEPLYMEDPHEDLEEFWKSVEESNSIRDGMLKFSRYSSPWYNRCPVQLFNRKTVIGNPKFAVTLFQHVYLLSSLNAMILFCKNPRPYLKLEYLEPICRIIIIGTKSSGKTMLAHTLSWLFNATIIDFKEFYDTEKNRKFESYSKTILPEIIGNIEETRFTRWQLAESIRTSELETWYISTLNYLKKYILLCNKYSQSFDNDEEHSEYFNKIDNIRNILNFLPFLDNITMCDEVAQNHDELLKFAPKNLVTIPPKPDIPTIGDYDVTEAISLYIIANDLQNQIEPTSEELMLKLSKVLFDIDSKIQEDSGNKHMFGKWVIDNFPTDQEYWDILNDYKLLPDNTISIIENREIQPGLFKHYIKIDTVKIKNYEERFVIANDPLIKIKLLKQSPLVNLTLNMQIIVDNILKNAFEIIFLNDVSEDNDVDVDLIKSIEIFNEAINKFRENWDNIKLKLEENFKSYIEIDIENKTDIQIIEEVLLKIRNSYNVQCMSTEDIELEDQEETDESLKDLRTYNSHNQFCETNLYCPIAFYEYGVLWKGKSEFRTKFNNKCYNFCNEEFLELFQKDITKWQSLNKPYKRLPSLKICVIGCIGSGRTTISKIISKELGIMHIDFSEILNEYFMPKHVKKIGRQYENIFTDRPMDEEMVTDFQLDEENQNQESELLSNDIELRKMIFNYFERGSPLNPKLLQKLLKRLWFHEPFVNTGFVLDGFPRLPTDVEDMLTCLCIPDLVIDLEGNSEISAKRLSPLMFQTWKQQLIDAQQNAILKLEAAKKDWQNFITTKTVVKLICDEVLENMFFTTIEPIKDHSKESVIFDADPTGLTNIDSNLFNTYNDLVKEYPEPINQEVWETPSDARERITSRIEALFELDDESIQAIKDILFDQKIQVISVDAKISLIKLSRVILYKIMFLKNRNDSFFEQTFVINNEIAEMLLTEGFCFISKFNRMCPVFIYENPGSTLCSYKMNKFKNNIFCVIHRCYMYFICNEEYLKKFRLDPLKYIACNNIISFIEYPLTISVIGPPKSGKSMLSANIARKYGLLCVSRGTAIRNILDNFSWTKLASRIKKELLEGKCVSTEHMVEAIQTILLDYRTTTTGFVLDGFPETPSEATELLSNGIYPNIVFDVISSKEGILENSQSEIHLDIIKTMPPYPRGFIENRYTKWSKQSDYIRNWINSDVQNIYIVKGNSKWDFTHRANSIIKSIVPKIHNYLVNVKTKVVKVYPMCISNDIFQKRMSQFKTLCPVCLQNNVLRHSNYPVDRKNVVQYKNIFYWICEDHVNSVLKHPDEHLITQIIKIPEIPAAIKTIDMTMVYENGICIVTYAENLPSQKLICGTKKFAAAYNASRVPVPDERFDFLCNYHKPASKVPAFLNVVDIAGLVKGAAEGQGLGNAFLSHIKACDAIFNLCRAFDDEDVIHVDGEVNPVRDLETIGEELRLKDEEQLMQNFEKLDKVVSRGGDKKLKPEYDALTRIKAILVDEKKHIRFGDWSAADIEVLNKYLFITSKPALYLVNLSEKDYIRKKNKWLPKLKEWIDKNDPGAPLIPFSGVLETKLMDMDATEKEAFLKENNLTSALDKIIVQGYKALQLEYFFTAGADEVKAWTIQKGTKAPQAAGRIHTDFEKGFIMAEVMHYKDFKEEGSEAACKSAGKYRQQGRNYVVEDGDIIFFKFNAGAGLKDAKKK